MRLQTIREAIAAQLGSLQRGPTVFAYDPEARTGHNITVIPADEYYSPETMTPTDIALYFDLRVEVPGRLKDSQIAMDDYLSMGVGSTSSVIDAILADGTLGGAVEDSTFITTDGPDLTADPLTALIHFRFMVPRG